MPSQSGIQIPVPTSASPTALPASGLWTDGSSSNGDGSKRASVMNATKQKSAAIATRRQRRERKRPFGKTYETAIGQA